MLTRRHLNWLLGACFAVPATALYGQSFTPIQMKGDFIWTAINNAGTLGSGGAQSPGLVYDPSGTGNFDIRTDYITPGDPYEGFTIKSAAGMQHNNNNDATSPSIVPTSLVNLAGTNGFANYVRWTGTGSNSEASPAGGDYAVAHDYYFNPRDQRLYIKTRITANTALTGVKFLRTIDPDPDVDSGGDYDTSNTRGKDAIPATDYVESFAPLTGRRVALYTNSNVPHNTQISSSWSEDPDTALAGTNDGEGDNTIGVGFNVGDLAPGQTVELVYNYVFLTGAISGEEVVGGGTVTPPPPPPPTALLISRPLPVHNLVQSNDRVVLGEMINRGAIARSVQAPSLATAPAASDRPLMLSIAPDEGKTDAGMNLWLSPFGSNGEFSPSRLPEYSTDSFGALFGIEKPFAFRDVSSVLGVAAGYADSDIDVADGSSGEVDSYLLGAYASINPAPYFINASLLFGYHQTDAQFAVANSDADYDAYSVSGYLGGGVNLNVRDWFTLTPEAGFQVGHYRQESYRTDGDLVSYEPYARWSYVSRLGAAISRDFELRPNVVFCPYIGAYWLHEFNPGTDAVPYQVGSFATSNTVRVHGREADTLRIDLGVQTRIGEQFNLGVGVSSDFAGNDDYTQVYAKVGYVF